MKKHLFLVGLLCTCVTCGSPISSDEATELLVSQLWEEDSIIHGTCRELAASRPNQLQTVLSTGTMGIDGRLEILLQDMANVEALFRVLNIDLDICPVGAIVTSALPPASSPESINIATTLGFARDGLDQERCYAHLESVFAHLQEEQVSSTDVDLRRSRVFQALRDGGLSPSDLLYHPFEAARLIDLSPAVVFTVAYFADRMDELVRDLADSFGFASGLVSLLIQEVAAELLAISVESILEELEGSGSVSRANVARRACELYETGISRPNTTVRLLKRMILRFQIEPYSRSAERYSVAVNCRQLSSAAVCEEMLEELGLEEIIETSDNPPQYAYEELVPQLQERTAAYWQNAPVDQATLLLEAAMSCGDPCTIDGLNRAASVALVAQHNDSDPAVTNAFPISLEPTLYTSSGQLQRELQALRHELTAAHHTTTALVNLYLVGESSTARLRHEMIETIGRLADCHLELGRVQEARMAFANELLAVTPPVTCQSANQLHQSTRFEGVRIPSAMICDPSQPFDFDIGTDGLFETCQDEPLEPGRSMLAALAEDLALLEPEAVVVIGHADERPIESSECIARFENNTVLSEARANAVRQLLADSFENRLLAPIPFYTTGVGELAPRAHCGPDADDECHLQNRRVALRLIGAHGLDFDFSCVGGNE